ncbi:MAG TPA: ribonuclease P protein component [Terriglobales bacterium]|nr:ribonuclease P protein component [Terriglobales bacterium]
MSSAGARFPKSSRLLKHADFDHVYQNGKRQFSGHMTVFSLRRDAGAPRVGLTVGRALGGSVVRNRIKRRLREAVRRHLHALSVPVDLVINPRKSVLTLEFAQLEAEVAQAFEKIGRQSSVAGRQPEA